MPIFWLIRVTWRQLGVVFAWHHCKLLLIAHGYVGLGHGPTGPSPYCLVIVQLAFRSRLQAAGVLSPCASPLRRRMSMRACVRAGVTKERDRVLGGGTAGEHRVVLGPGRRGNGSGGAELGADLQGCVFAAVVL